MTDSEARALKLFRDFHGREASGSEVAQMRFPEGEIFSLAVGSLYGLIYKTREERKPFIHRFNVNNRPLLYVSADGKQIFILKGGFRFTPRGFVG